MKFRGEIKTEEARRAFKRAPQQFSSYLRTAMDEHGASFVATMQNSVARAWSERNNSRNLSVRSGALRRSIKARPVSGNLFRGLELSASVGDAKTGRYVFSHEYGATIRPVRAKYLTIPASDNLTAGGRVRFESVGALIRAKGDQVVKKGLGIFLRTGKTDRSDKPMFWLSKGPIRIPARLRFQKTWTGAKMRQDREAKLSAAINRAIAKINGGGA